MINPKREKKKLKRPIPPDRSFEQIRNHYEVERAIASKLKQANVEGRKAIYEKMYEELFKKVPDHPRLKQRTNDELAQSSNKSKLSLIRKFADTSSVFLEFAPGDCRFAMEVCKHVKYVYGVDISKQSGQKGDLSDNFELIIYDGYDLDLEMNAVDIVFSDQLIEHLHPDDVILHFKLVRRILKRDGAYIFWTPHVFSGPHDISRYFSYEPEGFHLKEYTYSEMITILKGHEYSRVKGYWNAKGLTIRMPLIYFRFFEIIIEKIPRRYRRYVSKIFLPKIVMVAFK